MTRGGLRLRICRRLIRLNASSSFLKEVQLLCSDFILRRRLQLTVSALVLVILERPNCTPENRFRSLVCGFERSEFGWTPVISQLQQIPILSLDRFAVL
jgi:hypothetical protein